MLELNEIIKRNGGIQLKEGETLEEVRLNNIQSIINSFEEKINEIELTLIANKNKGTEQIINSYNKQIEFNAYQEVELKEKMKVIGSTIDYNLLKQKASNEQTNEGSKAEETRGNSSLNELRSTSTTNNMGDSSNNRVISVDELLDRANSELQIQKYHLLNERGKAQEERKNKEKELRQLQDYMTLFERVKEDYKKFSQMKVDNERIKDVHQTLKKLEREIQNFDINLLKNIDKLNYDNNSLLSILEQSIGNIKKLDQKVMSMNIDQSNEISKKIINNFNSNSNLAKQNNLLMQEIIYHSQSYYYKVFDKLLKPEKIENFTKLKEIIDYKKASLMTNDSNIVDDEESDSQADKQENIEEEESYI